MASGQEANDISRANEDFISALEGLTASGKLRWRSVDPKSVVSTAPEYRPDLAFETKFSGRRLLLSRIVQRAQGQDILSNYLGLASVPAPVKFQLQIIGPGDTPIYAFPALPGFKLLLDQVAYSVVDVPSLIEEAVQDWKNENSDSS